MYTDITSTKLWLIPITILIVGIFSVLGIINITNWDIDISSDAETRLLIQDLITSVEKIETVQIYQNESLCGEDDEYKKCSTSEFNIIRSDNITVTSND